MFKKALEYIRRNAGKKHLEFMNFPYDSKTAEEILAYVKNLKYNTVVMVGIGGAMLGGKMLVNALKSVSGPRFIFIDNIDPDYFADSIASADLNNSIFVIASKSGNTIETITNFSILKNLLVKRGVAYKNKMIILTENNENFLNETAKKEGLKYFYVSRNTIGRFSVLGLMGLVPATLAKINTKNILEGAQKIKINAAMELATMQYLAYKKQKKPITVIFPYSNKLNSFAEWYIQLLSESIGKTAKIGPTPIKAIGATDQHSQLQLFMQGPNNKLIIFVEIEKFRNEIPALEKLIHAEAKATADALTKEKRPNITIKIERLDEKNLGALIYTFELQIAILGQLFKVNAFNQPGVESSKKLTQKYLHAVRRRQTQAL